jgi:hypothetical protein
MNDAVELERKILDAISAEAMRKHVEFFCGFDRTSGTEGEYKAVDYIVKTLRTYPGVEVEVHEFDAYLSFPVSASVELVSPGLEVFKAKTRSFSGTTPAEGVVGEIVYIPGGSDMFRDFDTASRFAGIDLAGKVVLSEGGGRQNMRGAQDLGAVGYIHLWPSDEQVLHEGIVTPVWGCPTPETFGNIPRIPVVTVTGQIGKRLAALSRNGPVKVRVFSKVETGWRRLRLPVARIRGESEDYVLAAGHVDSWHLGATDNASGNATCLELARVFANRAGLRRSVKIAWWPGHSTGRYAGSTWFADKFWMDLHDHCITYLNIDSPGPLGATDYSTITAVAENGDFAEAIVRELTVGQNPKWERPVRAGDQSFWGPGITSLFMLLSERPKGQRAAVGGSGSGWWWHTEEDTIDKISMETLVLDTKIHALAIARLCTLPLLPFKLSALAAELRRLLSEIGEKSGQRFDFSPVSSQVERFTKAADAFDRTSATLGSGASAEKFNAAALRALKLITPVNYTKTGPFDHDAAIPTPAMPGLHQATALARLEPGGNEYRFLVTRLMRESNRAAFAIREAAAALESVLD